MRTIQGKPCPNCGLVRKFQVTDEEFARQRAGEFIQDAFPNMDPADREAFITGYCPPCWDSIFCFSEED